MSLNLEIVNEIAAELGIDPAFVEKDWYSVQVLSAISAHQSDTICTVFSVGTSLSKGYGLLKRFSEDLDFRCRYLVEGSGHKKRKYAVNIGKAFSVLLVHLAWLIWMSGRLKLPVNT